ncbi:gem-associated protein 6 [Diachasma alloeum]|uniref:gem-associated protein 6 n=1 Tax=Diachasma alloeum TaxID=454923 RepID=UPI0007383A12|nr:gem-associated protein 6 [Diachasma alloeum]
MSNEDESKYSHRIYKNDPVEYRNYVNKRVKITGKDSSVYEGVIYTVDPVSESIILMNPKESGDYQAKVVIGDSVKSIEILENSEEKLPEFFSSRKPEISIPEIQKRKEELMRLLIESRIPVVDEDDVLKIQGAVSIEPPYEPENCLCANPIIMTRLQGILAQVKNR